jgi:hypothetical protein
VDARCLSRLLRLCTGLRRLHVSGPIDAVQLAMALSPDSENPVKPHTSLTELELKCMVRGCYGGGRQTQQVGTRVL